MTVVVGTNSYLSIADADTYWSARNSSVWCDADDAVKEKALIEATQYIDGAFSFIGTQKTDNVLAWPRFDVFITKGNFAGVSYDSLTIPPQITSACAELAFEALTARLIEVKERGGLIKREKIDVIEVEYMDFAPSGTSYTFIEMLLKPLTMGGKNMKGLIRT